MKLKYYLRGTGIGIVITTLIFMIAISMHKNDLKQSTPVSDTESKTVMQAEEDKQEDLQLHVPNTEAVQPPEETETEQPLPDDTGLASAEQNPEQEEGLQEEKEEPKAPETQTDTQSAPETKSDEKIRVEISGGQYSDVVCRKLEEAGLIEDAKAFNEFLVQKDYDNSILPGVYDIPKGSTYEEIARLLTTKAE